MRSKITRSLLNTTHRHRHNRRTITASSIQHHQRSHHGSDQNLSTSKSTLIIRPKTLIPKLGLSTVVAGTNWSGKMMMMMSSKNSTDDRWCAVLTSNLIFFSMMLLTSTSQLRAPSWPLSSPLPSPPPLSVFSTLRVQ